MRTILETYGGGHIDYAAPRAEDVSIRDVAHALSNVCRYGGHSSTFYSVAEHAILCARLLRELDYSDAVQLAALHHDSHEAYLGDIPTPLKRALGPVVQEQEANFDAAIREAFGVVHPFHSKQVRWADARALAIEVKRLKRSRGQSSYWSVADVPVPWYFTAGRPPADVEGDFLRTHLQLGGHQ